MEAALRLRGTRVRGRPVADGWSGDVGSVSSVTAHGSGPGDPCRGRAVAGALPGVGDAGRPWERLAGRPAGGGLHRRAVPRGRAPTARSEWLLHAAVPIHGRRASWRA